MVYNFAETQNGTQEETTRLDKRPYLDEAWDLAEDKAEFVVSRYRDPNANLRTQLLRILQKAGVSPWPTLFQNLRASRATELAAEHPAHVAAAWLGHSTLVAQKHYWQVTDSDFDRAANAAQNPAHSIAASDEKPSPRKSGTPVIVGEFRYVPQCIGYQVPPHGLEP